MQTKDYLGQLESLVCADLHRSAQGRQALHKSEQQQQHRQPHPTMIPAAKPFDGSLRWVHGSLVIRRASDHRAASVKMPRS